MALIECKDVSKNYGSTVSLKQVNLSLEAGRIVGLLGPNGSGKTTLIKLLEHLLVPTSGLITLNELAPGAKTKSFVSYLPDRDFLPDWMKVNDLIKMYKDFYEDFGLEVFSYKHGFQYIKKSKWSPHENPFRVFWEFKVHKGGE